MLSLPCRLPVSPQVVCGWASGESPQHASRAPTILEPTVDQGHLERGVEVGKYRGSRKRSAAGGLSPQET